MFFRVLFFSLLVLPGCARVGPVESCDVPVFVGDSSDVSVGSLPGVSVLVWFAWYGDDGVRDDVYVGSISMISVRRRDLVLHRIELALVIDLDGDGLFEVVPGVVLGCEAVARESTIVVAGPTSIPDDGIFVFPDAFGLEWDRPVVLDVYCVESDVSFVGDGVWVAFLISDVVVTSDGSQSVIVELRRNNGVIAFPEYAAML